MKLQQFIKQSKEKLDELKGTLEKKKLELTNFLEDNVIPELNSLEQSIIIQDRIKGSSSLAEKIIRKGYYEKYEKDSQKFINDLPDLIGIRLVCFLKQDEKLIDNKLKAIFKNKSQSIAGYNSIKGDENLPQLYIKFKDKVDTQANGHEIYKYECKWVDENNRPFNTEIQVKSLIHMFWGEMEHMLIYKNYGYLVDKEFYSNIMNTNYKLLENVDSQLLAISEHLNENKRYDTKELKEMIAKIFYRNYQGKIQEQLEFKIDLRYTYDTLVFLLFKNKETSKEILEETQNYFNKTDTYSINIDSLTEECNENLRYHTSISSPGNKEFANTIDFLLKHCDLRWKILYSLYTHLNGTKYFTDNIASMSVTILDYFIKKVSDNITVDEDFYLDLVTKSLSKSLKLYCKIDFFVQKGKLLEVIEEEIISIQEYHEEFQDSLGDEDLKEFMILYMCGMQLIALNKTPDESFIDELYELANKVEIWTPEKLDMDSLSDLKDRRMKLNYQNFKSVFEYSNEEAPI